MEAELTCCLLAAFALGCGASVAPVPRGELGDVHVVRGLAADPATDDRGRLRHDMRQRLNELRDLEAALAADQLEEVRALAFLISRPPATLETSVEIDRVIDSARAVADSSNMIEARFLASRISAACAGCHPFRSAPGVWR